MDRLDREREFEHGGYHHEVIEPTEFEVSVEETPFEHVHHDSHHDSRDEPEKQHRFEVTETAEYGGLDHDYYHHREPVHFIVEEPMHEEHHETFHGRELGYVYREHPEERDHGHLAFHADEPEHGIRHGETFGKPHRKEDKYESTKGELHDFNHRIEEKEIYVEPVFEHTVYDEGYGVHGDFRTHREDVHGTYEHGAHETLHEGHHEIPMQHPREVEYVVDEAGHVHEYEETPKYKHTFLQ